MTELTPEEIWERFRIAQEELTKLINKGKENERTNNN